jgi:hypothetical protein
MKQRTKRPERTVRPPASPDRTQGMKRMKTTPEAVRLWNEAHAKLGLTPARVEELPVELDQLSAAAEAVREDARFDIDPSDFRAALLACRPGPQR